MSAAFEFNEEVKKISIPDQKHISLKTLLNVFSIDEDCLVNLKYTLGDDEFYVSTSCDGKNFLLPIDQKVTVFRVETSSRPATPMQMEKSKKLAITLNSWENRVFLINGDKFRGTCVLIDDQNILTAAHLSFKKGKTYQIHGTNERTFTVQCKYINAAADFAMLHSKDLPNLSVSIENLNRGDKYYMMGYPMGLKHNEPTVTKGIIEGMTSDSGHLVGTPGSRRGYSGAPVFDESGRMAGLLLGSTSSLGAQTTVEECLPSMNEQKYARILGILECIHMFHLGNIFNFNI
ncbi:unnamed protein product [Auanema sp. JU1783]|nr:unnamed protein product [Auanema sp. JU1783]